MRAIDVRSIVGLAVWLLLPLPRVDAYELRTHASITDQSFSVSQGLARYLNDVGIRPGDVFDPQAITPAGQLAEYENAGTPRGWMIEGAIREDDYRPLSLITTTLGCDPPLNPPSSIDRPF